MHTIKWNGRSVSVLDQRLLPVKEVYNEYTSHLDIAEAITDMQLRGAPLIGIAAAMGIALAAKNYSCEKAEIFAEKMNNAFDLIRSTRPTAVNLFKALNHMKKIFDEYSSDPGKAAAELEEAAKKMLDDDIAINRKIGMAGSSLLNDGDVVMTHCNAGALATGGFGTALGVIRAAAEEGKHIEVVACETRPLLQGARLTAWELFQDSIPVTLITDSMAAHFMKSGLIKKVITGADRIAANGDSANKIGTYGHSVQAKHHGIPFYIAAPLSTVDPETENGDGIVIEQRDVEEVAYFGNQQTAPEGIKILNPAFDVTPAENISAIITEKGLVEKPDRDKMLALFNQ